MSDLDQRKAYAFTEDRNECCLAVKGTDLASPAARKKGYRMIKDVKLGPFRLANRIIETLLPFLQ